MRPRAPQQRQPALAGVLDSTVVRNCDARCERFAACRPDSPGWVLKKQAAANLESTPSALRQRAARLGYVSPSCRSMPRRDQPKLCLNAAYFVLQAQARKRK
jgi:hypothetical protein